MQGSWAVSFGMPSQAPEVWREDLVQLRADLEPRQLLSVSVVGTMQPNWSLGDLAQDYATCGLLAQGGGANLIEANFSCPNVATCDGQLYQQPRDAAVVAQRMRSMLRPDTPLLIKIGHLTDDDQIARLLEALAPAAQAVVAVNSIAARVRRAENDWLFDGQPRGVCGNAIRDAAVRQVGAMRRIVDRLQLPLSVIGVGGVESLADVQRYLDAGAEAVQLATAVMRRPAIAIEIHQQQAHRTKE
jgi:dihydroorotate dehydrogenase